MKQFPTFQSICFDIAAVWRYIVCRYARDRYAGLVIDAPTVTSRVVTLCLLEVPILLTLGYEYVSVWISAVHFLCFLALILTRPQSRSSR